MVSGGRVRRLQPLLCAPEACFLPSLICLQRPVTTPDYIIKGEFRIRLPGSGPGLDPPFIQQTRSCITAILLFFFSLFFYALEFAAPILFSYHSAPKPSPLANY
ncbi:hypothetical protein J3459_006748 [Metarhizium acridum]|nr:hypothetical protein J3459_006748 [Metarhizium acridum]